MIRRISLPNGEVEYELSKWSNDSNPDLCLSVRSLCAVALRPCLLACLADCLARTSKKTENDEKTFSNYKVQIDEKGLFFE